MTKDEALKMAIDWIEKQLKSEYSHTDILNACKEALEQPTQDYVLICKRCGDDLGLEYVPDEQPAMTYEQGFDHGYEAHRVEAIAKLKAKDLRDTYVKGLSQPAQRNFCERCGKRASKDSNHIHTCTPPQALKKKNHVS
jgi:rubrerythrin